TDILCLNPTSSPETIRKFCLTFFLALATSEQMDSEPMNSFSTFCSVPLENTIQKMRAYPEGIELVLEIFPLAFLLFLRQSLSGFQNFLTLFCQDILPKNLTFS